MTQVKTHPIVPYLIVDGAARAIDFYVRAFMATEVYRLAEPGGRIGHAELTIEGAPIMLADEHPELELLGPLSRGGSSCALALYVSDVDAVVAGAIAAGATAERPTKDEFYGERVGQIRDPFGHRWSLHTPREALSPATIEQRYAALMKAGR